MWHNDVFYVHIIMYLKVKTTTTTGDIRELSSYRAIERLTELKAWGRTHWRDVVTTAMSSLQHVDEWYKSAEVPARLLTYSWRHRVRIGDRWRKNWLPSTLSLGTSLLPPCYADERPAAVIFSFLTFKLILTLLRAVKTISSNTMFARWVLIYCRDATFLQRGTGARRPNREQTWCPDGDFGIIFAHCILSKPRAAHFRHAF